MIQAVGRLSAAADKWFACVQVRTKNANATDTCASSQLSAGNKRRSSRAATKTHGRAVEQLVSSRRRRRRRSASAID